MQKNLNLKWEKQARQLRKDTAFAASFAKFILEDALRECVDIESVAIQSPKGICDMADKIDLVATIAVRGFKRTMEISLYKNGFLEHNKSFKCCYYCVEAPSILLDSGRTSMKLELREDLLERWKRYNG